MKFGKLLEQTQTPEWKKKYIDYRKLKKCIKDIRAAQEHHIYLSDSPIGSKTQLPLSTYEGYGVKAVPVHAPLPSIYHITTRDSYCSCSTLSESVLESPAHQDSDDGDDLKHVPVPPGIEYSARSPDSRNSDTALPQLPLPTVEKPERLSFDSGTFPRHIKRTSLTPSSISLASSRLPVSIPAVDNHRRLHDVGSPMPLCDLLPLLSPLEASFFKILDEELVKINDFYVDRESEMRKRGRDLEEQLSQLSTHSKAFDLGGRSNSLISALLHVKAAFSPEESRRTKNDQKKAVGTGIILGPQPKFSEAVINIRQNDDAGSCRHSAELPSNIPIKVQLQRSATRKEGYLRAKKKIKKAMLEHYRALEMLNNYRNLNETGFRKILKKFEKVTKIPALQAYMQEKVEPSVFAAGENIATMIKRVEDLFATQFECGDNKKATDRLRVATGSRSHHFSTLRSGFMLGLAIPALISGLYYAFQDEVRHSIPAWDGLLYLYGSLFVATFFSLLVGLNIMGWSYTRINYALIFDLDARTRLDNHQYFETPAFFLATLIYSFWLSFSGTLHQVLRAEYWPLVWLGFIFVILFNPLPALFRPSRWWFLKRLGRLLMAGSHRVEFSDFWMADQFCSLVYPLTNIYFMGCGYTHHFNESVLHLCGASSRNPSFAWLFPFLLAALPNFIRLVQCIRRYCDSGWTLHLVNGGKYTCSMITYFLYYLWRAKGTHSGLIFVMWCFFSTIHAIYACSWDFLMDWSIMRPKFRFLRRDLVYTGCEPLYYFAIISNALLRFMWVMYMPSGGPSMEIRSFLAGFLEILRRFQWNFYRVENEHLGNMDDFRVIKDVQLPYSFENEDGTGYSRGRSLLKMMLGSTPTLALEKTFSVEPSKYIEQGW